MKKEKAPEVSPEVLASPLGQLPVRSSGKGGKVGLSKEDPLFQQDTNASKGNQASPSLNSSMENLNAKDHFSSGLRRGPAQLRFRMERARRDLGPAFPGGYRVVAPNDPALPSGDLQLEKRDAGRHPRDGGLDKPVGSKGH